MIHVALVAIGHAIVHIIKDFIIGHLLNKTGKVLKDHVEDIVEENRVMERRREERRQRSRDRRQSERRSSKRKNSNRAAE